MKPRGRGIPGLPSLDIPKAVAAALDEALTGIRERHATLAKLTKFSPSSAYWRRLHMDIGVLLEHIDHITSDAARALGKRGGAANTPAQQAHREKVMGKGRPKGAKNRPKPSV